MWYIVNINEHDCNYNTRRYKMSDEPKKKKKKKNKSITLVLQLDKDDTYYTVPFKPGLFMVECGYHISLLIISYNM